MSKLIFIYSVLMDTHDIHSVRIKFYFLLLHVWGPYLKLYKQQCYSLHAKGFTFSSFLTNFVLPEMVHRILKTLLVADWKHSAGKFYPMPLSNQTWLLPINTRLNRWVKHPLNSALIHRKKLKKMTRWMVRDVEEDFYWCGIHKWAERGEKYVTSNETYFE